METNFGCFNPEEISEVLKRWAKSPEDLKKDAQNKHVVTLSGREWKSNLDTEDLVAFILDFLKLHQEVINEQHLKKLFKISRQINDPNISKIVSDQALQIIVPSSGKEKPYIALAKEYIENFSLNQDLSGNLRSFLELKQLKGSEDIFSFAKAMAIENPLILFLSMPFLGITDPKQKEFLGEIVLNNHLQTHYASFVKELVNKKYIGQVPRYIRENSDLSDFEEYLLSRKDNDFQTLKEVFRLKSCMEFFGTTEQQRSKLLKKFVKQFPLWSKKDDLSSLTEQERALFFNALLSQGGNIVKDLFKHFEKFKIQNEDLLRDCFSVAWKCNPIFAFSNLSKFKVSKSESFSLARQLIRKQYVRAVVGDLPKLDFTEEELQTLAWDCVEFSPQSFIPHIDQFHLQPHDKFKIAQHLIRDYFKEILGSLPLFLPLEEKEFKELTISLLTHRLTSWHSRAQDEREIKPPFFNELHLEIHQILSITPKQKEYQQFRESLEKVVALAKVFAGLSITTGFIVKSLKSLCQQYSDLEITIPSINQMQTISNGPPEQFQVRVTWAVYTLLMGKIYALPSEVSSSFEHCLSAFDSIRSDSLRRDMTRSLMKSLSPLFFENKAILEQIDRVDAAFGKKGKKEPLLHLADLLLQGIEKQFSLGEEIAVGENKSMAISDFRKNLIPLIKQQAVSHFLHQYALLDILQTIHSEPNLDPQYRKQLLSLLYTLLSGTEKKAKQNQLITLQVLLKSGRDISSVKNLSDLPKELNIWLNDLMGDLDIENLSEKFANAFGKSRNPLAFFAYLNSLKHKRNAREREKIFSFLKIYFKGVLEETFHNIRYDPMKSAHLKACFDAKEGLKEAWVDTGKDLKLESLKLPSSISIPKGWTVCFTDDPYDLLLFCSEVPECLNIYDGKFNHLLPGHLLNGKYQVVAVKDSRKKIIGFAVAKLLLDEKKQPILLVEELFTKVQAVQEQKAVQYLIEAQVLQRSKDLDLPLFSDFILLKLLDRTDGIEYTKESGVKLSSLADFYPQEYINSTFLQLSNPYEISKPFYQLTRK